MIDLKARREIAQIGAGEEPVAVRLMPRRSDPRCRQSARQFGQHLRCGNAHDSFCLRRLPGRGRHRHSSRLVKGVRGLREWTPGHGTRTRQFQLNPGQPDRLQTLLDVGVAPVQLALKPDGGEAFVSNSLSDSISEIDTSKNDVGGAYLIGDGPVRGLVSSDNSMLYVANFRSQYVTLYSIEDGRRQIPSIHVGDGPTALAFSRVDCYCSWSTIAPPT